jgi:predicted nucleotidyltransferase component of viral defense system
MIPRDSITEWSVTHPWPTVRQVEQDLLLSRAAVEIANHPLLGRELVFLGGTAFHKLHLPVALRYSEDLDCLRTTSMRPPNW